MPNVIQILNALRAYKPGRKEKHPDEARALEQMTLSEFGEKNLAILVKSKLFGEDIVFISNPRCHAAYGDSYVTYLPQELEEVLLLTHTHLLQVHKIKKQTVGMIVGHSTCQN